ncbi:DUF6607 family protein [Thermaurantiacus sp.]
MPLTRTLALAAGLALLPPSHPPLAAHGPIPAVDRAKFEADRAAILGMAGTFRVRFDMTETTPWRPGYQPIEPKVAGGHETVLVIEDSGRHIKLQHLLVVEGEDGKPIVIKHWRQDWTYEPTEVLIYAGQGQWKLEPVPERMRKGRWSQTVWQTDDSPRYGGWGEWETQAGILRWRSNWTTRPLPRRDAIRNPVYDHYVGINRHSPTPTGWIHWQDNTKMATIGGRAEPVVQETVLNSYDRFDGYETKAATDYWAKTSGYWAAVRAAWDEAIRRHGGIRVPEEADAGSVTGPKLMGWADRIAEGRMTEKAAVSEARRLIAGLGAPVTATATAAALPLRR